MAIGKLFYIYYCDGSQKALKNSKGIMSRTVGSTGGQGKKDKARIPINICALVNIKLT